MEHLSFCLVCGGNHISKELSCKDFVASTDTFDLCRCADCSFLFTNPRPSVQEISPYYQSDRYVSHAGSKDGFSFMYRVYDVVRGYSIGRKLKLIKSYHPSGDIMDLGCGLGYFLNALHKDGSFRPVGVDISEDAVNYVKQNFGLTVRRENELGAFTPYSFDAITQWHVLEHVHALNERMQQLKRLLKKDGTLFIAVPNSNSWDAKHYGAFWDGYDVPRHLYHFNKKSFSLLMKKHGFRIVETRAMIFDAPYISMRSEVHRGNSAEFLRGAASGILSTMNAWANGNYSSLLFVVKNVL
jgi:2-polyprenyl-3-methyl-5-hydroxy-6-metoxy-1,4-benzoquinol methylase